ncbi:MAG: MATE family efflux transporter [Candidatus Xenobiia bacterium LiM19]
MRDAVEKEILHGNLVKAIFVLVIPILGSHFLETAWHFLNGFWIGRLGPVSFAAINISSFVVWMFYAVVGIMNTGTSSLVAQMVGAGKDEDARKIAHQGLIGSMLLSGIYSLVVIVFGKMLFAHMGAKEDVVILAYQYSFLIFVYGVPFGILEILSAILRGYGDTKTPFRANIVGFVATFILDPLLILGLGPFPRMGVTGGAVATIIGFSLSLLIYGYCFYKRTLKLRLSTRYFGFDGEIQKKIVKIGLPPSVSSITFSIVYILLSTIISRFGTEALAALGIGHRIESFSFMICLGFSLAGITVVGQNIGAGNTKRAEKAAWILMGIITSVTAVISVLYYFFADPLVSIFISDPKTHAIGMDYMKIVAFCQIFMGIAIVLDGVFSGSGDTLPPMLICIPVTLLRVPCASLLALSLQWGVNGVWWAITILVVVRALLSLTWFSMGRWKLSANVQQFTTAASPWDYKKE